MSIDKKNQILKSAKIFKVLSNLNIIRFREIYSTLNKILCLVMGYAEEGNLKKKIIEGREAGKYFFESQILD